MKKIVGLALLLCLMCTGCSRVMDGYEAKDKIYRVAASNYPMYALSLIAIQGASNMELTMLTQPQDGCLRAYQMSEWDALQAANYDALILGGRGLESYESAILGWEDAPILLCAMQGLELINNGVTAKDEETGHFDDENPWLFLSPDGAMEIVRSVAANMEQIDPEYAGIYAENLTGAETKMEELAVEMYKSMTGVPVRKAAILHEGLCYFADFMGLECVCTYERESGSDVTDNMRAEMLEKLTESGAEVVLLEKQAPDALVGALEDAGFSVARIDTLSAHAADGDPEAYYRIMRENGEELARACRRER